MSYPGLHKLRLKASHHSALSCVLVFILLVLLLLPGLPQSFAGGNNTPSGNKSAQEAPAISFVASFHQTNLVSNLPGVALVEDPQLSMPWGVALNSSSPFGRIPVATHGRRAETDAHLHGPAAADTNGGIILALPAGNFVNFETQLSAARLLDLSGGLLYVDVHSTNFPNGEIRGQLPRNLFVPDMLIRSLDAGIITRAQALRLIAESEYFRVERVEPRLRPDGILWLSEKESQRSS